MPFVATGNRHGRAFPQVPSDSRPLRHATRRRRASSTIDKFVADERGVNFPPCKALKTQKTWKGSLYGRASFASLVAPSRACPEMAPQRFAKIESAPENGMVSEASKPQHLVSGAWLTVRSGELISDPRLRPGGHGSRIRSAVRWEILVGAPAQWPRSTNSTRENAARKSVGGRSRRQGPERMTR